MQEALECGTRLEEGQTLSEMESNAQQDYRGYFWCGGGNISLKEKGKRISGTAKMKTETDISVKKFDPENFLRLLRAAGI